MIKLFSGLFTLLIVSFAKQMRKKIKLPILQKIKIKIKQNENFNYFSSILFSLFCPFKNKKKER